MRRWPLLALLALAACAGPVAAAPALSLTEAQQLALEADDRRRLAFAEARPDPLSDLYRGPALAAARVRAQALSQRRQRLEERPRLRCLVHWQPGSRPELVLEVRGERRLTGPRQPDPPWSAFVRQWWLGLEWAGGRWWVTEEQEVPPARWWPPTACTAGPGMV